MDGSFKDFTVQYLKLTLPVGLCAVAKSLGFDKTPISKRQVMGTAGPYQPDVNDWYPFVDNSNNVEPHALVAFFWGDPANFPPWILDSDSWGGPDPNPARQATSWRFTLWQVPGGAVVFDTTVPLKNENTGEGKVQYPTTWES
jgi:hypothetical protein